MGKKIFFIVILMSFFLSINAFSEEKSASGRYSDNGDGTITDNMTGLMWKKCAEGQSANDCSGEGLKMDWAEASNYASKVNNSGGFAGYIDWRVPNIDELNAIVEKGNNPTINSIFEGTKSSFYWSSTTYMPDSTKGILVYFLSGEQTWFAKTSKERVRLVRTTTKVQPNDDSRYTDCGEGVVIDNKTGLMWKKCSEGQNNPDCTGEIKQLTWDESLRYVEDLNKKGFAGYSDWRLPNIDEMRSIVEKGSSPSINNAVFPNNKPSFYWTSSIKEDDSKRVKLIYFLSGDETAYSKTNKESMRLVRNGQILPVHLSAKKAEQKKETVNSAKVPDVFPAGIAVAGTSGAAATPASSSKSTVDEKQEKAINAKEEKTNNALYLSSSKTGRFKDNGNGTVTDRTAALMWKKCSEGQISPDCTEGGKTFTWKKAVEYVKELNAGEGFVGYKDWRLPTKEELRTIVVAGKVPSVDDTLFPNTQPAWYWTSTETEGQVWFVHFKYGFDNYIGADNESYVRLVRTEK